MSRYHIKLYIYIPFVLIPHIYPIICLLDPPYIPSMSMAGHKSQIVFRTGNHIMFHIYLGLSAIPCIKCYPYTSHTLLTMISIKWHEC